jgi:hypothetical protein
MKNKLGKRSALMTLAAMAGAIGMLLTAAPAQATSTTLTGTVPSCGTAVAYGTARTNSFAQNAVTFKATNVGPCGGTLTIALRNSSGKTYARGTAGPNRTVAVKADNGNYWVGAGTFYVNASSNGACGSSTCAAGKSWAAAFTYNVRWTP